MKSLRAQCRKSAANRIKGYAAGGRVVYDVIDDIGLPEMKGSPFAESADPFVDDGRALSRLDRPGRKEAKTNINIIVAAKEKPEAPVAPPPPMMAPPAPPMDAPPQGMPPMPMRAHGGRVSMGRPQTGMPLMGGPATGRPSMGGPATSAPPPMTSSPGGMPSSPPMTATTGLTPASPPMTAQPQVSAGMPPMGAQSKGGMMPGSPPMSGMPLTPPSQGMSPRGMPLIPMRKHGGRVSMDSGSGGGLGRLEKIKDYGKKASK